MIDGQAIGGRAIGDAGLRRLATEHGGPRPAGVPRDETAAMAGASRAAAPTRP